MRGQDQGFRVVKVRFDTEILVGQLLQSSRNERDLVPNALRDDQLAQRANLSTSLLSKINKRINKILWNKSLPGQVLGLPIVSREQGPIKTMATTGIYWVNQFKADRSAQKVMTTFLEF